jgi:hypothetical protein
MATTKQIWTYKITNDTLVIDESFNLKEVSMKLTSGTGTFSGSAFAGSVPSQALDLVLNAPITVGSGTNVGIDGLTIVTTGTVELIGR